VEAAIAEKLEAMVHLDMQNSRMKDFYDIWILSRTLAFSGPRKSVALAARARPRWQHADIRRVQFGTARF
jgi:nucleotidyltransferase AbiEii toxin of type IV toxin-antitoxin system